MPEEGQQLTLKVKKTNWKFWVGVCAGLVVGIIGTYGILYLFSKTIPRDEVEETEEVVEEENEVVETQENTNNGNEVGSIQYIDPLEAAKAYGPANGLSTSAQYTLIEKGETIGESSGLFHSAVEAVDEGVTYRIFLTSEPVEEPEGVWAPLYWVADNITNWDEYLKFKVQNFEPQAPVGYSPQELQNLFNNGQSGQFLSLEDPKVKYYFNVPVQPSTFTPNAVVVKISGVVPSGAVATTYAVEQGQYHNETFPMYVGTIDLSGINSLASYSEKFITIELTSAIRGQDGEALDPYISGMKLISNK